ncbi:MAG TPA: DNA ligase D [Thermoanaerobaculia bacterium]|jgi:bifunctional non-homologous end joining protein LigD|nr:DNA ligase D [Thermoanaerobaculia bacterium]
MALQEYKRKRNFRATPEPAGKVKKTKGNSFVIQKHAATRLHYDFRLEMEGVLRSWAVPKGPSLDPDEKRLAVHVEDHPIEYGDFEGTIPKGEYGGGTVLLWDRGTWKPEGDPIAGYKKGHLRFQLDGEKLHGGWDLVRMGGRRADDGHDNWLLIKVNDEAARSGSDDAIVKERPESVASGMNVEEIAAGSERVWRSNRPARGKGTFKQKIAAVAEAAAKEKATKKTARTEKVSSSAIDPSALPEARKVAMPSEIEPQLATLVEAVPRGDEWIHEIKYDGYRVLCELRDGEARLITRRGKDWTDRFVRVAREVATLPAKEAILDGEVVVLEPNGTTSFQALQNALSGNRQDDLVLFAFDLLYLDGWDLRRSPLAARKEALAELLAGRQGAIRLGDHVPGGGEEFYSHACRFGLEGIVSKRADLAYHSGRSKDWLKVKCLQRQEFVIVGFTNPEKSRVGLGALLLGVYDGKELVYAGKVGTGFDDRTLVDLRKRLDKLEVDKPAFKNPPRGAEARRSHWVKPELVAEVAFTEWTDEGVLRHPTFQGLREDKSPREVVRERPQALPPEARATKTKRSAARKAQAAKSSTRKVSTKPRKAGKNIAVDAPQGPKPAVHPAPEEGAIPPQGKSRKKEVEIAGVRFSNPEKVLYPEQGLTKRDLALYYSRIADWILPYLADRPLTLVRCPEGRSKQCFYQKHITEHVPSSVRRVDVGEPEPYGAVSDLEGLLALVQMGVLEIHIWGSHRDKIELPDYVVFDLDPDEGLPWERVVEGAYRMRDFLGELGLQSFLKTTGGKGLHVVIPLVRRDGWDEVKAFTKAVAEAVVAADPSRYTSKLPKASRKGKVFIDYLRNGRGATSICAYSTRARPGATVSAPLFWEELEAGVRGDSFNLRNIFERLESLPSDPWAEFSKIRHSITAAMKKSVGMK